MEQYLENPEPIEKLKGIEVLSFEKVELTKTKANTTSFVDIGTLDIIYLQDYNRFVLYLNGWGYALLKRLPVTSSSKSDMSSRFYTFPVFNGFYTLKLNKIIAPEAVQNFETILKHNSRFSYKGEEGLVFDEGELSPDDGLVEDFEGDQEVWENQESGPSTAHTTFADEANPDNIKGTDKLKRSFARIADKVSRTFTKSKAHNTNLTVAKDISGLKATDEAMATIHYMDRENVERIILRGKNLASQMEVPGKSTTGTSFKETITSNVRETFTEAEQTEIRTSTPITEAELEITNEIEREKLLQEKERKKIEGHRQKEYDAVERERALREFLKKENEERRSQELEITEFALYEEIINKDQTIQDLQKQRDDEIRASKQLETDMLVDIEMKNAQLRSLEKNTEEEIREHRIIEEELLNLTIKKEHERRAAEERQNLLLQQIQAREAELRRREQLSAEERALLMLKEQQLKQEAGAKIAEMIGKEQITEEEFARMKEKEEEILIETQVKEVQRLQIEQEEEDVRREATEKLIELRQKTLLTEAEFDELKRKEGELQMEAERRLGELQQKERSTEKELMELGFREQELARMTEMNETERLEIVRKEEELGLEMKRKEIRLKERERLTEGELAEIKKLREELRSTFELQEAERRDLEQRIDKIVKEGERRDVELRERAKLSEEERLRLQEREKEMQREIEARLRELNEKERLTEEECLEVQRKEEELLRIIQTREIEVREYKVQDEKFLQSENLLLEANEKIMHGLEEMQKELEVIQEDLKQQPIVSEGYSKERLVENTGRGGENVSSVEQHRVIGDQEPTHI